MPHLTREFTKSLWMTSLFPSFNAYVSEETRGEVAGCAWKSNPARPSGPAGLKQPPVPQGKELPYAGGRSVVENIID